MSDINLIQKLEKDALETRKYIVNHAIHNESHLSSQLCATDIFTSLYQWFLNYNSKDPNWHDRDFFLLGKAHASLVLYYLLAKNGFFPLKNLDNYEQIGSSMGTNVSHKVPGVEASQGSLGHGLSLGTGMAIIAKKENRKSRIVTLVGDGELHEGSNWEAIMLAPNLKLDNMLTILDNNGFIGSSPVAESVSLEPVHKKFESFGWATKRINGNNMSEIISTLSSFPFEKDSPSCIVADTTVGKGVPFLENDVNKRGSLISLTEEEGKKALEVLQ